MLKKSENNGTGEINLVTPTPASMSQHMIYIDTLWPEQNGLHFATGISIANSSMKTKVL